MGIWSSFVKIWLICSCEFKANFLSFLVFIPLGFFSRSYWRYLNHHLMANIWEKAILILVGNLNSGLSYLITTVIHGFWIEFAKLFRVNFVDNFTFIFGSNNFMNKRHILKFSDLYCFQHQTYFQDYLFQLETFVICTICICAIGFSYSICNLDVISKTLRT